MYGKLFASTFTGSMFGAGENVFAVWGWIIANAGANGVLEINPPLVAAMLGSTPERVSGAVAYLCGPDPESRSKTLDGRRLVKEGGIQYRIVNHGAYRSIRDEEARREYNREKKRESRERLAGQTTSNAESTMSAQAEAEAEAEAEAVHELSASPDSSPTPGAPAPDPCAPKAEPAKAPRSEPPDVAQVLDAVVDERRRSGAPGARRDTPASAHRIDTVRRRIASYGVESVLRAVRRQGVSVRREPVTGGGKETITYLTASTILRPANLERLLERDDLDPNGASGTQHRTSGGVVEINEGQGWRTATAEEREQARKQGVE